MRALRPTFVHILVALFWLLSTAAAAFGLTIERPVLGTVASESACSVSRPVSSVASSESHLYFRFQARRVRSGDRLLVEWIDPLGGISSSAVYDQLPAAPDLCFVTALPLAGFPPAARPGNWWVRIQANGQVAFTRAFEITGDAATGGLEVTSVETAANGSAQTAGQVSGQAELHIQGSGFLTDTVAHIARYSASGGWTYIAASLPVSSSGSSLVVRTPALDPAEYLVIVQNPDGRRSPPARFLISTQSGYKLPMAGGVSAQITQGPYGSTHYGNSLHAFDIAAPRGACVLAMRPGVARTFDLGLRQTPSRRIFGNYITIEHDNGEFSHYAHLATRTFQVRDGQRVEQGQPLAVMGNSGYTLGSGGGYHVHVHITRALNVSSGSIPFRFEELPLTPKRSFRGVVHSSNNEGPATCGAAPSEERISSSVAVADWWQRALPVPPNAGRLQVRLEWDGFPGAFNLHVVSPSGRAYGAYGDPTGYSGAGSHPETLLLSNPEPGIWRVGVHGVEGTGAPGDFRVSTSIDNQLSKTRALRYNQP